MNINPLMNNQIQNRFDLNSNLNSNIKNKQNLNFKGAEKEATKLDKTIAKGVAWLAQTKGSDKLVNATRRFKSAPARWCDIESVAVTLFYMWNTWKSDKIDEDRKVPSMIQNGAVTIASSAAAALVDSAFDPLIDKIALKYRDIYNNDKDLVKQIGGKNPKEFYGAIKKLKSNTVFTAVVRFIIPVLMVPVVGKIVSKINEKRNEDKEEEQKNNIPQLNMQNTNAQPVQNNNQIIQTQNITVKDDDDHDDHDDEDDKINTNNSANTFNSSMNNNFNNNINTADNKFKSLFA